jgi:hypothetical protein
VTGLRRALAESDAQCQIGPSRPSVTPLVPTTRCVPRGRGLVRHRHVITRNRKLRRKLAGASLADSPTKRIKESVRGRAAEDQAKTRQPQRAPHCSSAIADLCGSLPASPRPASLLPPLHALFMQERYTERRTEIVPPIELAFGKSFHESVRKSLADSPCNSLADSSRKSLAD